MSTAPLHDENGTANEQTDGTDAGDANGAAPPPPAATSAADKPAAQHPNANDELARALVDCPEVKDLQQLLKQIAGKDAELAKSVAEVMGKVGARIVSDSHAVRHSLIQVVASTTDLKPAELSKATTAELKGYLAINALRSRDSADGSGAAAANGKAAAVTGKKAATHSDTPKRPAAASAPAPAAKRQAQGGQAATDAPGVHPDSAEAILERHMRAAMELIKGGGAAASLPV